MEIKNNRNINKFVTITTGDLDLIENNASDVFPYAVWVDKKQAEENGEIRDFVLSHPAEYELLKNGEIDFILIEYDM